MWRTSDGQLERTVDTAVQLEEGGINLSQNGLTAVWIKSAPTSAPEAYAGVILNLESRSVAARVSRLPRFLMHTSFSLDGEQIAFWDPNGPVLIVDARAGNVISSTIRHSDNLTWAQWDPASRRMLTAGDNDEVLVWDVRTGVQLLGPLRLQGGSIRIARWSPDGRFIIARNDARQVRVWDASTGEAITPLLPHSEYVGGAGFLSPTRFSTGTNSGLRRVWDLNASPLPADVLQDYAKLLSGRQLSRQGVMLSLGYGELAQLSHSLLLRAPELFR